VQRQTDRQRKTDRQTERQRKTDRQTAKGRQRDRVRADAWIRQTVVMRQRKKEDSERQTHRNRDGSICRERETDRQTECCTNTKGKTVAHLGWWAIYTARGGGGGGGWGTAKNSNEGERRVAQEKRETV
jgi:hypothetical protein